MDDDEALEFIRRLGSDAVEVHSLSSALGTESSDGEEASGLVAALVHALDYRWIAPESEEQRQQWGRFRPMWEIDGRTYPQPLQKVPESQLDQWWRIFENVGSVLVQSRLGDLLWERKHGKPPHKSAERAVQAYLALSDSERVSGIEKSYALVRALELATNLRSDELRELTARRCVEAGGVSLASNRDEPGVYLTLLRAVNRLPLEQQPQGVDDLVAEVLETNRGNPRIFGSATEIALSRASDVVSRRSIQQGCIDVWEESAQVTEGILRSENLRQAIELATAYGFGERADELRRQAQDVDISADFEEISVEVNLPRRDIDAFVGSFIAADWQTTLGRFGAHCPLSGSRAETEATVRKMMDRNVLQFLVTKTVVGDLGIPIARLSSHEEHLKAEISQHEVFAISVWSVFAVQVLARAAELEAIPTAELVEFFDTPVIGPAHAHRFAAAFRFYLDGDYDAALFVCLPRIESVIRDFSRRIGLLISVEPSASRAGRFKTLGRMLGELNEVFDDRRLQYLQVLLVDPLGRNLRNRGLHGLISEGTAQDAALALHVACFLALLGDPDAAETGNVAPTNQA